MNPLVRWLTHTWLDAASARRLITPQGLSRLDAAVRESECRHRGELRLCVEGGLGPGDLWRGTQARERAVHLFGALRVWDTAQNNGVLVYLLLAERRIEILADRGLSERVDAATWADLAARLGQTLQAGQHEAGLKLAIDEVGALLRTHFPVVAGERNPNELPDAVVLL